MLIIDHRMYSRAVGFFHKYGRVDSRTNRSEGYARIVLKKEASADLSLNFRFARLFRGTSGYNLNRYGSVSVGANTREEVEKVFFAIFPDGVNLSHINWSESETKKQRVTLHPSAEKFFRIVAPNTHGFLALTNEQGWLTVHRKKITRLMMAEHLAQVEFKAFGEVDATVLGTYPHPGGRWDEDKQRWFGGVPVRYINIDLDCQPEVEHLDLAERILSLFRAAGAELRVITSSYNLKEDLSFYGVRLIAPIKETFYSVYRFLVEEILKSAGVELKSGFCEVFPDSGRGTRLPYGRESQELIFRDEQAGTRFVSQSQQEAVERFINMEAIDLEEVARTLGIEVPDEVRHPWKMHVKNTPLSVKKRKRLEVPKRPKKKESFTFVEESESLLETGFTGPDQRYESVQKLIAYFRMKGLSRSETLSELLTFFFEKKDNGWSSLRKRPRGSTLISRFVRGAVNGLYARPFRCEGVLTSEKQERSSFYSLRDEEVERICKTIEGCDEDVPDGFERWILEVMGRIKIRSLKCQGEAFHVSSTVFRKASRHQKYSHYLSLAEKLGFLKIADPSYQKSFKRGQGYTKKYTSEWFLLDHFRLRFLCFTLLYQYATQQRSCFSSSFVAGVKRFRGVRLRSSNDSSIFAKNGPLTLFEWLERLEQYPESCQLPDSVQNASMSFERISTFHFLFRVLMTPLLGFFPLFKNTAASTLYFSHTYQTWVVCSALYHPENLSFWARGPPMFSICTNVLVFAFFRKVLFFVFLESIGMCQLC